MTLSALRHVRVAIGWTAAALAIAGAPAQAGSRPDARADVSLVRALYVAFAAEAVMQDPMPEQDFVSASPRVLSHFFTPSLVALLARDRACEVRTHEICRLGFSPLWDSQDPAGAAVQVTAGDTPGEVTATVRYPQGLRIPLRYHLVRGRRGWRISDIDSENGRWSLVRLLGAPLAAASPSLADAVITPGGKDLTFLREGRRIHAPRTEPEQQGFSDARISPDGRTLAWLATTANCCTSYPLPMALVVYRDGHVSHVIRDDMAIWAWAFRPDGDTVAYRMALPHGRIYDRYRWRRMSDGRLLGTYECGEDVPPSGPAPAWVTSVAEDCPAPKP